ncbi:MAG: hypothetical protein WDZ41_03270 [Candidatus Babeliales bacterium]
MQLSNRYLSFVVVFTTGTFLKMLFYKMGINKEATGFISISNPIITILSLSIGPCLLYWWRENKESFMSKKKIKNFFSKIFRIWLIGCTTKFVLIVANISVSDITSLYALLITNLFMFAFLDYQDRKINHA